MKTMTKAQENDTTSTRIELLKEAKSLVENAIRRGLMKRGRELTEKQIDSTIYRK
jgi:ribosomal protein L7Ae-like RNA K-turn-binding protein